MSLENKKLQLKHEQFGPKIIFCFIINSLKLHFNYVLCSSSSPEKNKIKENKTKPNKNNARSMK